jgi:thiamine pyrophosphate-dependent acetolactate synthase large subunit-like protein
MAAFEAMGFAKFSGEVGVCVATSGPGASHLLNGLYDAKLDHVPVVAVVGQTENPNSICQARGSGATANMNDGSRGRRRAVGSSRIDPASRHRLASR